MRRRRCGLGIGTTTYGVQAEFSLTDRFLVRSAVWQFHRPGWSRTCMQISTGSTVDRISKASCGVAGAAAVGGAGVGAAAVATAVSCEVELDGAADGRAGPAGPERLRSEKISIASLRGMVRAAVVCGTAMKEEFPRNTGKI